MNMHDIAAEMMQTLKKHQNKMFVKTTSQRGQFLRRNDLSFDLICPFSIKNIISQNLRKATAKHLQSKQN